MAVTDEYRELKSQDKVKLFEELILLKAEKSVLDKRIKELESGYKEEIKIHNQDVFYQLPSGVRFSIKRSVRKGGYDAKLVDEFFANNGIMSDYFKKADTTIMTFRVDK